MGDGTLAAGCWLLAASCLLLNMLAAGWRWRVKGTAAALGFRLDPRLLARRGP